MIMAGKNCDLLKTAYMQITPEANCEGGADRRNVSDTD